MSMRCMQNPYSDFFDDAKLSMPHEHLVGTVLHDVSVF